MGIIGWIVLGLVAGAIAKAVHRGDQPGGILGTLLVGVLGALAGGLVASAAGVGSIGGFFNAGTWAIAILGAFVLLVIYDVLVSGDRLGPGQARPQDGRDRQGGEDRHPHDHREELGVDHP